MHLELIIKGSIVETMQVDIDVAHHITFEHRAKVVHDCCEYLKRKYRIDLMITDKWRIDLVCGSAMNYLTDNINEDEDYREAIASLKRTG